MKKHNALLIITFITLVYQLNLSAQVNDLSKSDTIHIAGHSHMDMNWEWTYFETMKMCNDNLRQAVAFMEELPDFTMLQSQAAVYNFVERVDPPLFQLIKQYVKSGRLEPVGGTWTEGDTNLPSGEALTRSFLLGQRYFQKHFGRIAKIGWLPDNFGHCSQLPQILKLAGCDYFGFFRCQPYKGTFWWQGTDSSKVLCYTGQSFSQRKIFPQDLLDALKLIPGKHRTFYPIGHGDHGGGPTREMIDLIHQLDSNPDFPAVKFTSAEDFFSKASNEMDGRPTHYGEMQFVFEGCYTSVAGTKEGNRNLENTLFECEFFNTLRWLNGDEYPADELYDIWETLTFNQFHDILPGSAIYESNRQSIAGYIEELRKTTELHNNAFRKMADEIKYQADMGQPIVAYNFHPYEHKTLVSVEVYSHIEPVTVKIDGPGHIYGPNIKPIDIGQGKAPTILVRDGSGKTYPAQIIREVFTPPGFTSTIQFVVDDIPSAGYRTFYVDVTKPGEFNEPIPFNNNIFETDYFKVRFDMNTGAIVSLIDKRTNKEYVREGGQLNKLKVFFEDKSQSSAWTIGEIVRTEDVNNVESIKVIENGPVRACIETVKTWGESKFYERIYLYRSYPRISYDMEVHWLETSSDSTDAPMLRALFPLAIDNARFDCNVPFDVLSRPVNGQEVPAQKWVDVTDGSTGVALLNKSKYGHSYYNGELRLTLMRSPRYPDPYSNLGKYHIKYALFPHSGDWKNGVWTEGDDFNNPVYAAEPPSLALVKTHATRPEEASFFSVDAPGVVMTGMKRAEEGDELIVRLSEVFGKESVVNFNLPFNIKKARRLNLIELPLENEAKPIIEGESIRIKIKPHEILTLGITMQNNENNENNNTL